MKFGVVTCWLVIALVASASAEWIRIVPSATVELRDPRAISLSKEGLLYVSDTGHNRIIAVDSAGGLIAETGGFGLAHGQFKWPQDINADFGSAVWVVDYGNRRIEKFSRSLTYQGTLEITVSGDDTPHQPEMIAFSPHGDLYVYDRDGGRLVCYDPLFNVRAEYGGNSGAAFVSDVANMIFVPKLGLIWRMRGQTELHRQDNLLNPVSILRLPDSTSVSSMSAADTCLILASDHGIYRFCWVSNIPNLIMDAKDLAEAGIRQVDGIACSAGGTVYVLDGKSGAIYRTNLLQK